MLMPSSGPCKGAHLRYYYDRASMSCQKFVYGGCKGNQNNFESLDACNTACSVKAVPLIRRASTGQDRGVCMLIPDAGPCKGSHLRYYYDRAAMSCQKFLYGGCHGNGNNFETLDACSSQCGVKSLFNEPVLHACPLHGCTPYRLKCGRGLGLKKDENGCTLCECATGVVATAEENVPCPFHSCTAEMLGCEYGLTVNDNGCEFCTCAPSPAVPAIPCPLHSCSLENMQCEFGLATNENGCELCECAIPPEVPNGTEAPAAVACPAHACSAENMGCTGGLATNENGCELCECAVAAPVMCPLHSCTAEAMGCLNGLATDERGCDMCECAGSKEEVARREVEKALGDILTE
uniref:BPTI/Kunitz inhibitor domain-containing protein n=1 Tax=Ciona savignyi TaxID=51511 RepID=H2YTV0_CIOSA